MPPKSNIMEVMNNKLDQLFEEISSFKREMREMHETLAAKDRQISDLKRYITNMNERVAKLEDKIADNDVKLRENNIILSGEDLPPSTNGENCTEVVRELFQQKLRIIVPTTDIVSAERIGKQNDVKKNILLKMKSFTNKMNIIKACQTSKPNFYANDDLPAEKQTILYVVRQAKKKFPEKISGCSSNGGKLFAYVKPDPQTVSPARTEPSASEDSSASIESPSDRVPPRNRRKPISNLTQLKAFSNDILGCGLESFIETRPY